MLVRLDLELSLLALHVNLVLLGSDEGSFVDVGMDFNIGVIAEFQRVLPYKLLLNTTYVLADSDRAGRDAYPFAVVDHVSRRQIAWRGVRL